MHAMTEGNLMTLVDKMHQKHEACSSVRTKLLSMDELMARGQETMLYAVQHAISEWSRLQGIFPA